MSALNNYYKNLPDYYPTMYLDGYMPQQIFAAAHRTIIKRLQQQQQEQQERETQAVPTEIIIKSEVKLK